MCHAHERTAGLESGGDYLLKYFTDGKQIKQILEANPQQGKQLLMQNRMVTATSVQFAVRDWILPFMISFTELLKIMWQLWTTLKRKSQAVDTQRRGVEALARLAGSVIAKQVSEHTPPQPAAVAPPSLGLGGALSGLGPFEGGLLAAAGGSGQQSRFGFSLEDDPPVTAALATIGNAVSAPPVGLASTLSQPQQQQQQQQAAGPVPSVPTSSAIQPPASPKQQCSMLPSAVSSEHAGVDALQSAPFESDMPPTMTAAAAVAALAPVGPPAPAAGGSALADSAAFSDPSLEALNGLLDSTLDLPDSGIGSGWASVVRRPASEMPPPPASAPSMASIAPPSPTPKRGICPMTSFRAAVPGQPVRFQQGCERPRQKCDVSQGHAICINRCDLHSTFLTCSTSRGPKKEGGRRR